MPDDLIDAPSGPSSPSGPNLPAGFGGVAGPAAPLGGRSDWELASRRMPSAFDKLGPQARSIVVPGILLVVMAALGVATFAVGTVGVIGDVVDAKVFDDDSAGLSFGGVDAVACSQERRAVRDAASRYTIDQGRPPSDIDDLRGYLEGRPTEYTIEVDDGNAFVVPARGSVCGAGGGIADDVRLRDQMQTFLDVVDDSSSYNLLIFGSLLFGAAIAYQGYWLATAYRCLPRARQIHPPRRAYGPVVVYATNALVGGALMAALIGAEVHLEEPILFVFLYWAMVLAYVFFMVRALLRGMDMLGDVTFHFCGGDYLASRLMRLGLKGFFLVPFVTVLFTAGLEQVEWHTAAGWTLLVGLGLGFVVCPLVTLVSYVVAIVQATTGITNALDAAIAELDRAPVRA